MIILMISRIIFDVASHTNNNNMGPPPPPNADGISGDWISYYYYHTVRKIITVHIANNYLQSGYKSLHIPGGSAGSSTIGAIIIMHNPKEVNTIKTHFSSHAFLYYYAVVLLLLLLYRGQKGCNVTGRCNIND